MDPGIDKLYQQHNLGSIFHRESTFYNTFLIRNMDWGSIFYGEVHILCDTGIDNYSYFRCDTLDSWSVNPVNHPSKLNAKHNVTEHSDNRFYRLFLSALQIQLYFKYNTAINTNAVMPVFKHKLCFKFLSHVFKVSKYYYVLCGIIIIKQNYSLDLQTHILPELN